MGNNPNQKDKKFTTNQVVLKVKHEQIIIHHAYRMSLDIASLETFPHGLDGLRLWEAGIILSRYVVNNNHLFKNKRVLELGAGVGIAGMTAKKWTECREIEMTDYEPQVIENIKRNMEKNSAICPVFTLDWKNHGVHTTQYDIIMGSDIVYFGCPVEDLYQVFKENLAHKGIGLIVIPVRKNYA
jgi:predicted nicotinamide N-methyase